jgi:hypothetical protein
MIEYESEKVPDEAEVQDGKARARNFFLTLCLSLLRRKICPDRGGDREVGCRRNPLF